MAEGKRFIWYELMTTDAAAAKKFYAAVIGWDIKGYGGSMEYSVLDAGDGEVGGMMTLPAEAQERGVSPAWMGYIGVEDVDAAAAGVAEAGGAIHRPPEDIPGVGRFAVVADPQGAVFMLLHGATEGPPPQAFKADVPGHIGWNELHSTDWESGLAFYSKLYGWRKADTLDMGPMGKYALFAAGGEAIGGMMNNPEVPRPAWLFYFNVDDIDAAEGRVRAHGGKVLHGPAEVPGGAWIVQAEDPQGARFALVGPRKS